MPRAERARARRALALVTVCLGLAGLAACTVSPAAEPDVAATSAASPEQAGGLDDVRPQRYVALGDSFTSAPLVSTTDVADGCFRSDGNYPSLLAASLGLRLRDVSCAGATTADLLRRHHTVGAASVPPQLRAVDARTDLVTLGIGGNDLNLFTTLVRTCLELRRLDPSGAPCAGSAVGRRLVTAIPTIGDNVERAVEQVQRRAPDARVILVGYPRIAPSTGGCPRLLPLASGDLAFGDRVLRALDRVLRAAATATGVDFLDAYAASAGHDVCSEDPWVNGRRTQAGVALAFHPLAEGQEAIAEALEDLLAQD